MMAASLLAQSSKRSAGIQMYYINQQKEPYSPTVLACRFQRNYVVHLQGQKITPFKENLRDSSHPNLLNSYGIEIIAPEL